MRVSRALTIGFLIGCALALVSARPQNQLSSQDRILKLEIYQETLAKRVSVLEQGGSSLAVAGSRDIAVLQSEQDDMRRDFMNRFEHVERFLYGLLVAMAGLGSTFVVMVAKRWLDREEGQR